MPDANITKKALAESMKKLMAAKSFDKISVIDICNECGMNRKSFYYHFKDKYDLVNWIFYTDFIMLVSTRNYSNGWDLVVAVVDLFYKDRPFYKSALQIEGQNSFRDYFYESMMPIFRLFIQETGIDDKMLDENTHYMSDAFLAILNRWLLDGCREEPVTFTRNLQKLIHGIDKGVTEQSAHEES
ncbi:MAG: TetR/AcrR family transcriptional regulator C-terminal domain-containing protein [Eubacterium sp.]|nr:TetR/AcrR family transcriptional regulator C-terminal domain-containing protein [Eubacterium sp.]